MKQYSKSQQELVGLGYGFLGVLIFSLTLPATRVAVTELNPAFVGLGRAIIPTGLGAILLIITRQPIPHKRFLLRFMGSAKDVMKHYSNARSAK